MGDILRIDNSDLNNACDNGALLLFTTDAIQGKWGSNVIFLGDCLLYAGRRMKAIVFEKNVQLTARCFVETYKSF